MGPKLIDRGHFSLQKNRQIEIHGAFTGNDTSQTALSYHYDLLAKEVVNQSVIVRQYEKDDQQELQTGSSKELYKKLWLKISLACATSAPPAPQSLNTPTQPNGPKHPVDSSSLRVIDSRQCSNSDCKEFVDAMVAENGWNDPIGEHIKGLIPKGDIYKTLDVGISLPDVGGVDKSTSNPILVFFLGMPYFGIRKTKGPSSRDRAAADPESLSLSRDRAAAEPESLSSSKDREAAEPESLSLPRDRAAAEPESLSLSEYSSRGAIQSTYHGENEVWVHRAWFMVFSNDMIAMFRSKEDNHPNLPNPLYACQERVCMFLVLINIISNILELSQRRFFIFLEEVHEKDSEVDAYILEIELEDRNKKKEKTLTKDIWELERNLKNSKRVVQSQIDILGDIQKFYGDISSLIVPTREQISLALKRIEEIVKGLVDFSQRISYLLETLRKSKINLLNTLVGGTTKEAATETINAIKAIINATINDTRGATREAIDAGAGEAREAITATITAIKAAAEGTQEATKDAAKSTVEAIKGQRQVMSMLTILTTLFLPLGFFTSLYGMASDTHKKEDPQIFYWPPGSIGVISICFTAFISLITLCVVLKSRDPEKWWRFGVISENGDLEKFVVGLKKNWLRFWRGKFTTYTRQRDAEGNAPSEA